MSDTTELLLLMFVLLFATVSVFVLLPLGLLTILMNYAIVIRYYINGKQSSTVPMFGSIFAGIGLAWFPWYDLWHYWYVPFLVDFTWIMLLWSLCCFWYRCWKGEDV